MRNTVETETRRGFTLVELLVVVSVILAAILFPVFAKARKLKRITEGAARPLGA